MIIFLLDVTEGLLLRWCECNIDGLAFSFGLAIETISKVVSKACYYAHFFIITSLYLPSALKFTNTAI